MKQGRSKAEFGIPSEADWGDYRSDLDQEWAHDQYCGKSNEQMQSYFEHNAIESASDLQFMPEIPFRYYVVGFRDSVVSAEGRDRSDAASCFLNLVLQKLKEQPRYIVPVMPELLSTLEYIGTHQATFKADENIYGNFHKKLNEIKKLYEECKGRYRRL
jgi:hypothetical protein